MEFSLLVFADGNGFKTSTMRLGADVIVFSRCQGKDGERFFLFLRAMFILETPVFLCCLFCNAPQPTSSYLFLRGQKICLFLLPLPSS